MKIKTTGEILAAYRVKLKQKLKNKTNFTDI